ncbi:MAG: glycoside hydrolase family 30 protein [Treponemataceae bacterium]|nr:glycoside hydrolase family 30 protein [Treponemataceae bacterium]
MEISSITETAKGETPFQKWEGAALSQKVKVPTERQRHLVGIRIFPYSPQHTILGFGGALTESSAYVLRLLPAEKQEEILRAYFGSSAHNYTFGRTHLNSCDFSLGNWSCLENPPPLGSEPSLALQGFTIERARHYQIPLLQKAQHAHGKPLNLVLSPWSPPAWMKDNGDMNHGGKLKKEYYPLWARYICRYIKELEKENITVWALTIQNEPEAKQVWDSCLWTAQEEAEFAVHYLRPVLQEEGLAHIKILIWDHNRDRLWERVHESFSYPGALKAIDGAAYHWYSGDQYETVQQVATTYPDKLLIFTEGCIEAGPHPGAWYSGERYGHNIINDLNHGCQAWIDWNILLDMQGGPNHVGNYCDAPILADPATGVIHYQSSYYYLGHFSRFISPGAQLIPSQVLGEWFPPGIDGRLHNLVEACAVKNPDESLAVVVMNRSETSLWYQLQIEEHPVWYINLAPRSIQTVILS